MTKCFSPKPTRIIAPLRKEPSHTKGVTFRYKVLCDDGKEWDIRELSLAVGFKAGSHALYHRIRKFGWENPNVLDPPVRKGLALESDNTPGNEAWERLGRQERGRKLKTISSGGSWELSRRRRNK